MAVTVEELYKNENQKDITLLAGKGGMTNVVRWIHMIEHLDITTFLEGQEIAFTTGSGLTSQAELMPLIESVYQHKGSGLVVNVGPFISEIPDQAIEFCNKHDFPLFQVPWRVHMANIMQNFSRILFESEKLNMVLKSAVKNAIYFPNQEDLYIPSLESYQFLRDWSYCISVFRIYNNDNLERDNKIQDKVMNIIENSLTRYYEHSAVLEVDSYIAIFMANYSDYEIRNILKEIKKQLETLIPETYYFYGGMGECTKNAKCIYKSFKKAKNALMMQEHSQKKNQLCYYSDLGMYKLLFAVDDRSILDSYYKEILEPIETYDIINGTNLIEVLHIFFQCKCNVQETADKLYMHRNSIRYKLNKIEELLNKDLSDVAVRSQLTIALMIQEILSYHSS